MRQTSAPAIQGTVWISLNTLQPVSFLFFFFSFRDEFTTLQLRSAVCREESATGPVITAGQVVRRLADGCLSRLWIVHVWPGWNKLWSLCWRCRLEKSLRVLNLGWPGTELCLLPAASRWCISILSAGMVHKPLTHSVMNTAIIDTCAKQNCSIAVLLAQHCTFRGIYWHEIEQNKEIHVCSFDFVFFFLA